jgi:hypothetical protein
MSGNRNIENYLHNATLIVSPINVMKVGDAIKACVEVLAGNKDLRLLKS